MDPLAAISEIFASHIEEVSTAAVAVSEPLHDASEMMVHTLLSDGKILCAGSGHYSIVAQLFASHLVNQFSRERPGLPAIALSSDSCLINAISESSQYEDSIARQVSTLGSKGDVLVLLAGSSSDSLTRALSAAHERELTVILIHGGDQTDALSLLANLDIEIAVPASTAPRLLENYIVIVNCLCELIDIFLFGGE